MMLIAVLDIVLAFVGKPVAKSLGGFVMKKDDTPRIPNIDLSQYLKRGSVRREYTEDDRRKYFREISAGSNVYVYWDEYISKNRLPPYDWVVENIFVEHRIRGHDTKDIWFDFIIAPCRVLDVFQFYSSEFIDRVANSIQELSSERIVEVGAGDGSLSFFLGERGISVVATDDYSNPYINRPGRVEKIGHLDALKRYDPDLVIVNWEEPDATISLDVLAYPSVEYLLWIGETSGEGCTGRRDLWGFDYVDTDNPYCLGRTDHCWLSQKEINKHTGVVIFKPIKGDDS
jgi:hypothetical protein